VTVLFVPRETAPGERRLATTPDAVKRLSGLGLEVVVERDAGAHAHLADADFEAAGARVIDGPAPPDDAQLVARVAPPSVEEVRALPEGATLLSFIAPHRNLEVVAALRDRGIATLAMELVPRISRAQSMDALSSQASIAGYRSVIVAAERLDKHFPLFMTAAGTIRPANVVVLGAGVAGLQAVATAKRLGAVVHVSDIREAAKQEVASLGGKFIEVPEAEDATGEGGYAKEVGEDFLTRQRQVLTEHLSQAHAVITTAQIPGRPAPRLVTTRWSRRCPPARWCSTSPPPTVATASSPTPTARWSTARCGSCRVSTSRPTCPVRPAPCTRATSVLLWAAGRRRAVHARPRRRGGRRSAADRDGQVVHEPTAKLLEGDA
jgi:H+-translocating NAD(P) transhydrogenase subunit alpha